MSPPNNNQLLNIQPFQNHVATYITTHNGTVIAERLFNAARYKEPESSQEEFDEGTNCENGGQTFNSNNSNKDEHDKTKPPTTTEIQNLHSSKHQDPVEESGYITATGSPIPIYTIGSLRSNIQAFKTPFAKGKTATPVTPVANKHMAATNNDDPPVEAAYIANQNTNDEVLNQLKGASNTLGKTFPIYVSSLLDKSFKPTPESLKLNTDLEMLAPLILSQHEAFTQPIQDLGLINLTLTKLITKKKESFSNLKDKNIIPKSLRIKCELSTSPAFENNPDFLQLKEELQDEVSNFIQKGTAIMTKWAAVNIQLLTIDRCSDILSKAMSILDGLTILNTEILGTPCWPSVPQNHIPLFLLKLYFSNTLLDTSEIAQYLDLPREQILLLGAEIILKDKFKDTPQETVDSLNLSDIDMSDAFQNTLIREILINFHQILRITMIDLWEVHTNKQRQITAANILRSRMKAMETVKATESTALAITKATQHISNSNSLNLNTSLRVTNLERSLKRQEQRQNEFFNKIKKQKTQKNLQGSQYPEQLTSPELLALTHQQNGTLVDLTLDQTQEETGTYDRQIRQTNYACRGRSQSQKQPQNNRRQKHSKRPSIHWKEAEIKNFNPKAPAASHFSPQGHSAKTAQNSQAAPPPSPFHPSQLLLGTHAQTSLASNGSATNGLYNLNLSTNERALQPQPYSHNPFLPPANLQGYPIKKNPFGNQRY
jgi:hypothetical protein